MQVYKIFHNMCTSQAIVSLVKLKTFCTTCSFLHVICEQIKNFKNIKISLKMVE